MKRLRWVTKSFILYNPVFCALVLAIFWSGAILMVAIQQYTGFWVFVGLVLIWLITHVNWKYFKKELRIWEK